MTFKQQVMLSLVLKTIYLLNFIEERLLDLIKIFFIVTFFYLLFIYSYFNIYKINYVFLGLDNNFFYTSLFFSNLPQNNLVTKKLRALKINQLSHPFITSNSALVIDNKINQVLFNLDVDKKVATASTSKLMTALVALELYKPDQVFKIKSECTLVEGTKTGLILNESYTFYDLLQSLLISSGADASCTLANTIISNDEFVNLMNKKAIQLGMKNTNFSNPIGLDGFNNENFSTAWDLYLLSKASISNSVINDIVGKKEAVVKSINSQYTHYLTNTNKLLFEILNSVGIKTGTTKKAGEVLIYRYLEPVSNIDLIIIVVESEDRFFDTKNLLTWALSIYNW